MTVMSDQVVCIMGASRLVVLDPIFGPKSVAAVDLSLGSEILVVADGNMCFRKLISADECPPPTSVVCLATAALTPGVPSRQIILDANQLISEPSSRARLSPASTFQPPTSPLSASWTSIHIEGASCVMADNLLLQTSPRSTVTEMNILKSDPQPAPAPATLTTRVVNTPSSEPALRAFCGTRELPSCGTFEQSSKVEYQFNLPPRTSTLRLVSAQVEPSGDGRALGVAIVNIAIEGVDVALDSPSLARGFNKIESGEGLVWRWTNGDALLILPPYATAQMLSVQVTDWHRHLLPY